MGRRLGSFGLNYMGTKHVLAPEIANVIASVRRGPVLDGFSGMCAVGQAVGPARQIWSNDVQFFATTVANALFVYPDHPPRCAIVPEISFDFFCSNRLALRNPLASLLNEELVALDRGSISALRAVNGRCRRLFDQLPLSNLRRTRRSFPYRLFSYFYSGSYFSLSQCTEIDSIVYALHQLVARRALTRGQRAWLLIALGKAMQKVSTTTGHFAQYLEPKPESLARYIRQRKRSVWAEWLACIPLQPPLGTWEWRARNKTFRSDTLALLTTLQGNSEEKPAVVYADPPYTEDHYSRFYHLLETLLRYDYPFVSGKARYRANRFSTPFSIKAQAVSAFEKLAARSAAINADLVVSYPKEGLLADLGMTPYQIIRPHFRTVDVCRRIRHSHSTLGASKGPASKAVTEVIYWARP
jgi:adenine-specific DNA-methyltransferase